MAHQFANVLIHAAFSTKGSRDTIPQELLPKLWKYFAGIGTNKGIPVITSGGIANHVHLLFALPATMTLASALQVLKANSSRWIGEHGIEFAWQEGYGAVSVSASNRETVRHYIEHQAEHRAKHSFEAEFLSLLQKSGVPFDPDKVFD